MKRSAVVRPWDNQKRPRRRPSVAATPTTPTNPCSPTPFLTIGGTQYYSDRFYLHANEAQGGGGGESVASKDEARRRRRAESAATTTTTATASAPPCTCGAKEPPPTLDRRALLDSLDLQCIVLATYTMDETWVRQHLLARHRHVPTLILHGRPRAETPTTTTRRRRPSAGRNHNNDGDPRHNHRHNNDEDDHSHASSHCGEEEDTPGDDLFPTTTTASSKRPSTAHGTNQSDNNPNDFNNDDEDNDDDDWSIHTQPEETRLAAASVSLPPASPAPAAVPHHPHLFFCQIAPTWRPPPALVDLALQRRRRRERKQGVYHCKFMLLLERSGSLVVVVSTANLTRGQTTDASWVQRFPAATTTTITPTMPAASTETADFGAVLHDFWLQQSRAAVLERPKDRNDSSSASSSRRIFTPQQFWERYVSRSLRDGWEYSQACVALIPHVPGDFPVGPTSRRPHTTTTATTTTTASQGATPQSPSVHFCYGRQRVAQVLRKHSLFMPRLSSQDRLIVQPTSLGADWTVPTLAQVVRSYLPNHGPVDGPMAAGGSQKKKKEDEDHHCLRRLDIVWPSADWIQEVTGGRGVDLAFFGDAPAHTTTRRDSIGDGSNTRQFGHQEGGPLFLSSESFNRIDADCLSRMVQWEPTGQDACGPTRTPRVPHFKSIARLLHHRPPGVAEGFAWFLLTSACLSHGAQGVETTTTATMPSSSSLSTPRGPTMVSFRNFELGVLFLSRRAVPLSIEPSRVYCFQPTQCTCRHNHRPRPRHHNNFVHLPLPYHCRPLPYVEHPYGEYGCRENETNDDSSSVHHDGFDDHIVPHFVVSPYFHEILPGSSAVSNMLLTPYGKAVRQQQKD